MSWIRSAVNKAVEAGGNSNLRRTVRNVADSVVNQAGQAVVGGARLFQDRMGARGLQNCKIAVKRLEEVSVSCRGIERVQLLRRWLVALKEIERLHQTAPANTEQEHDMMSAETYEPLTKPTLALYYDPDRGGETLNFRDVFLRSQALEGITLSLILEESSEEELSLLLEIYRLCLTGAKDSHITTINSVRKLGKTFSTYNEEVLAKREELLQYAQDAIAGLKINAEIVRIDSEISSIHKKLDGINSQLQLNGGMKISSSEAEAGIYPEEDQAELLCIRLYSRLEELISQKKLIKIGDSDSSHSQKVDKLKVLAESLASSTSKAERRISENKTQKDEAVKFRVAKTNEVSLLEKELTAEIESLVKRRNDLESELKQVTASLTSAQARLHNTIEERNQFDEANNEIIEHFKLKEDELSKSLSSYKAEADVCNTFVNFLENTWNLQSLYAEQYSKLMKDESEKIREHFENFVISLLAAYKVQLGPSVSSMRNLIENLKSLDQSTASEEKDDPVNSRSSLVEKFKITETKFISSFKVIERIREQFYHNNNHDNPRESDARVKELLDELERIKQEFDSIPRTNLELETQTTKDETPSKPKTPRIPFLSQRQLPADRFEFALQTTSGNTPQRAVLSGFSPMITLPLARNNNKSTDSLEPRDVEEHIVSNTKKKSSEAEAQLSKLKMELELENHSRRSSMDGLIDWEFDDMVYDNKQQKNSI